MFGEPRRRRRRATFPSGPFASHVSQTYGLRRLGHRLVLALCPVPRRQLDLGLSNRLVPNQHLRARRRLAPERVACEHRAVLLSSRLCIRFLVLESVRTQRLARRFHRARHSACPCSKNPFRSVDRACCDSVSLILLSVSVSRALSGRRGTFAFALGSLVYFLAYLGGPFGGWAGWRPSPQPSAQRD